ncbi:MAG: efflux transporter outer membrane subunit, partial [Candidatus Omnitrophica bacterium]|nr:efflux transporter outer membrane subunit [Candidatus Omnitrophota bacterium]
NKPGDYRSWWKTFNDPVLDSLIDKAYKENLSLRMAAMRVLEARTQLGIAQGELFPQTQTISGSLQKERLSKNAASAISAAKFSQVEFGAGAIWELDFWGKYRRQIQSAKANWLSSVADYDNALVTLTADVATLYINIATVETRLEIATQNTRTQKESLKLTVQRYKTGAVTLLDVEQAKTILNNTLATIPPLQTQLRQDKNALCVLLGMAPDNLTQILKAKTKIPLSPARIITGIPADLLRRRPDIRSAEYQAIAQCNQIGVAKAELYPALSLNGTFGFSSSDIGPAKLKDVFKWQSRNYQAGPSFQWNVLNYGQITNNVRFQDARFQETLVNYQNTVLIAQQEVEDNLIAFLKSQKRAQLLSKSVSSAKTSLGLSIKQYQEGLKDFTTVLNAEQSLLAEQDNLAIALGDIANNTVALYRALGGGWEIREGKNLIPADIAKEMTKRTDWGNLLKPESYNPGIQK